MNRYQQILLVLCLLLEASIVLLAIRRRKISLCYSFFAYLVITFLTDLAFATVNMSAVLKRQLYRWDEFVGAFVKIVLVLELNSRLFKYYPRVRRSNQVIFFFACIFFFVYHWLTPQTRNKDWWFSMESDLNSKILQATCIVLLFMSGSILFYRLHIPAAYKYLLLGFLTSQFAVALGLAVLATFGEQASVPISYSNSVFFLLALVIWTRVYSGDG
jgi:hypothetical protein